MAATLASFNPPDRPVIDANPQRYTWDDMGNKKRGISDFIFDIDWREAPLLNVFGVGEGNIRKFSMANWPALVAELIEDGMPPWASTVPGATGAGDAQVIVEPGHGVRFRIGDLCVAMDANSTTLETVLVTSNGHIDGTGAADTLDVRRGYVDEEDLPGAGIGWPAGARLEIVSRVMPEGAEYTVGPQTTFEYPWNHVQILSEAARVTRTEQRVSMYGLEDRMAYEVAKLFDGGGTMGKLAQMLQKTFYHGVRQRRTGPGAEGSMGGFKTFVTPETAGAHMVIDLAGAPLERGNIHQIIRGARDNGGRITEIIGGSWFFEVILDMYEGLVRYTQDSTRGGGEITMVKTPHGEVELIYDHLCPPADLYFTNRSKIGWLPFDEFKAGGIEPQGDYHTTDVVGEYTFLLANAPSHGYITGMENPDTAP